MVPVALSSSVATASISWTPRSMPMYHGQLKSAIDLGSFGGVRRCARTCAPSASPMRVATVAMITAAFVRMGYAYSKTLGPWALVLVVRRALARRSKDQERLRTKAGRRTKNQGPKTQIADCVPAGRLVAHLGNHVCRVVVAAGRSFGNIGVGIRVQPELALGHHPRLQQDLGILHRNLVVENVPFAPEALEHPQLCGPELPSPLEPRDVVE